MISIAGKVKVNFFMAAEHDELMVLFSRLKSGFSFAKGNRVP
ncbi:hypothetical protein ACFL35_04525 [Candidatus Riflebacteria bacterium]